jgi:hypothetical protein
MKNEPENKSNAENMGLTTRMFEKTFEQMLNTIGNAMCDHAISNDEQHGDDEKGDDKVIELSKMREDDEPGWVMGTISKTGKQRMEHFRQIQIMWGRC